MCCTVDNFSCTPGGNASAHKSMQLVLMEMLAKSLQSLGVAVPEPVVLSLTISGFLTEYIWQFRIVI